MYLYRCIFISETLQFSKKLKELVILKQVLQESWVNTKKASKENLQHVREAHGVKLKQLLPGNITDQKNICQKKKFAFKKKKKCLYNALWSYSSLV